MSRRAASERKVVDDTFQIPKARGNGLLRREVWIDARGCVTRYNLAYINHALCAVDNGRVLGFDNDHGFHHRHRMGQMEPIEFTSFEALEERFETECAA